MVDNDDRRSDDPTTCIDLVLILDLFGDEVESCFMYLCQVEFILASKSCWNKLYLMFVHSVTVSCVLWDNN